MSSVVIYDDARARTFEPFASTRPVSEMVAGISTIRERWLSNLQASEGAQFAAGARHAEYDGANDTRPALGTLPRGTIIVNARAVPQLPTDFAKMARRAATCTMWRMGDQLAAVRLGSPLDVSALEDGTMLLDEMQAGTGAIGDIAGWWLDEVWDVIRLLPEMLTSDILQTAQQPSIASAPNRYVLSPHVTVLGKHPIVMMPDPAAADGAEAPIEAHVVLDATAGPILIREGAHIHAFTRINGPCYIGRNTNVMGGDISGCSIGDVCKVRGELSNTIFAGYANKGHDGFVGHSYLGHWVNLGAGTITSNLKNTYGPVALWTPDGLRDTGMQFLGTLFGDHVKTGIGLRLTTGTVLGAGSNVYGNMPPKVVPPFSWGDAPPYAVYHADKFLETAARMMSRRHVELTERARRHLTGVHNGRWTVESTES
jgi:UDP-N-acetylglucosamine diphosphorylase / glucose-1-phosphate thymidylyltransferase / UDP-N-acetylgalactosamine diphosphorylase / glucosamine-1-phosphate N-acetyltransferase / galactosamine-1-phosphate N-acetyltransferase